MITNLTVENFRNLSSYTTDLAPVTVITGSNGVGKTSLLEAIALFGGYRFTKTLQELIQWGKSYARARVAVQNDTYAALNIAIQSKTMRVYGDDITITLQECIQKVPVVYFSPQTVSLLADTPQLRRKFLDQVLITILPEYVDTLRTYVNTLRQRNAALQKGHHGQHVIWEESLALHGAYIILARNWILREIARKFPLPLTVQYHMSPKSGDELLPREGVFDENIKESKDIIQDFLQQKWQSLREKEIMVGFTLMGPQRDDWSVMQEIEGKKSVGVYGSRGEQRMAVITLQKIVLGFMKSRLAVSPIWILDDVFSELDVTNHEEITEMLGDYQTFITSANENDEGVVKIARRADSKMIVLTH